jgi:aspartate kinase
MVQPRILKFGGTSVADAAAVARVTAVVREYGGPRPVVVVSALAGATDALLKAADAAEHGAPHATEPSVDALLQRHTSIAGRLAPPEAEEELRGEVEAARRDIARLLDRVAREPERRPELRDEVASYGERLSASLLTAALARAGVAARYVDSRHCLTTDATYGRANPLLPVTIERTRAVLTPLVERGLVPVLGGYIAATAEGVTTTLGRGGSDYSAALVGAALDAQEIQIWTDVSGVLTADPCVVPEARTVASLSYAEAAELAYFGAKVLHPKTIQPAMDRDIPVRICNSRAPGDAGTVVTAQGEAGPGRVKAIAHKCGVTILQITSTRMLGAYGFLRALFEVFDRHRTAVDVVTTSEVSVSLTLEDTRSLDAIVADLRGLGTVSLEPDRAIVCVVGEGLRATPGIAGRVFATVRDINVSLISQGASRVNLTFVVEQARVREVVCRLHQAFFEPARSVA